MRGDIYDKINLSNKKIEIKLQPSDKNWNANFFLAPIWDSVLITLKINE